MDSSKDYYAILGVQSSAELVVIRAAYRALALKYHPDTWRGDRAEANAKIREINEANEVLSNDLLRRQYDQSRRDNKTDGNNSKRESNQSKRREPADDVAQSQPITATKWPYAKSISAVAIFALIALVRAYQHPTTSVPQTTTSVINSTGVSNTTIGRTVSPTTNSSFSVVRAVVASSIDGAGRPIGISESFPSSTESVAIFVEYQNGQPGRDAATISLNSDQGKRPCAPQSIAYSAGSIACVWGSLTPGEYYAAIELNGAIERHLPFSISRNSVNENCRSGAYTTVNLNCAQSNIGKLDQQLLEYNAKQSASQTAPPPFNMTPPAAEPASQPAANEHRPW